MRKLVGSTFITLDGVHSEPHIWGPPYWDADHDNYASKLAFNADALLLGRETYEAFAEAWPMQKGDYPDQLNRLPKYVASRTLSEATKWNASLLQGDLVEEITKLKQQPGKDILKFGTGELDHTLLKHKLIDQYHFWVFPVIAGKGERLLDGLEVTHFELAETTRFDSGIVVLTYNVKKD